MRITITIYSRGMDDDIQKKVHSFFSAYPKRTYPKDQIVIFSGESPEKIFYMLSGKISQYDVSYRGDEVVVNIYKAPAFFPMAWAINHTANQYFYKAEEVSRVYVAPPEDVIEFVQANPDVMYNLLSRLYKGIDGVLARTVHLMSSSARERVMYELLMELRRFGRQVNDNIYILGINETDLAAYAGLARETISREVKHLKDKGLVDIRDGHIVVLDAVTLAALLDTAT